MRAVASSPVFCVKSRASEAGASLAMMRSRPRTVILVLGFEARPSTVAWTSIVPRGANVPLIHGFSEASRKFLMSTPKCSPPCLVANLPRERSVVSGTSAATAKR